MNLYIISPSPEVCVCALDDRRLRRAMADAAWVIVAAEYPREQGLGGIPGGFLQWFLAEEVNAHWIYRYLISACSEFSLRFREDPLTWEPRHPVQFQKGLGVPASFPNVARCRAQGLDYTSAGTFGGYQALLLDLWRRDNPAPSWTYRDPPAWFCNPPADPWSRQSP